MSTFLAYQRHHRPLCTTQTTTRPPFILTLLPQITRKKQTLHVIRFSILYSKLNHKELQFMIKTYFYNHNKCVLTHSIHSFFVYFMTHSFGSQTLPTFEKSRNIFCHLYIHYVHAQRIFLPIYFHSFLLESSMKIKEH